MFEIIYLFSNRPNFPNFYGCEFHGFSCQAFSVSELFDDTLDQTNGLLALSKYKTVNSRMNLYMQILYQIGFIHHENHVHGRIDAWNIGTAESECGTKLFIQSYASCVKIRENNKNSRIKNVDFFPSFIRSKDLEGPVNAFDDIFGFVKTVIVTEQELLYVKRKSEGGDNLGNSLGLETDLKNYMKDVFKNGQFNLGESVLRNQLSKIGNEILKEAGFEPKLIDFLMSVFLKNDESKEFTAEKVGDGICSMLGGCDICFAGIMDQIIKGKRTDNFGVYVFLNKN